MKTVYVAWLRGINVGGNKQVKMELLKKVFVALGFENVRTYIASGNVLFETNTLQTDTLVARIEDALIKNCGFEIRVMVRTVRELELLVKRNPFKEDQWEIGDKLYACFLEKSITDAQKKNLELLQTEVDTLEMFDTDVLLFARKNKGKSLISTNLLEKKLKMAGTMRDWNTVKKMVELGSVLS